MSTIRTNAILDASGGTNATINGITPIDATGVLSTFNATGSAPVYACRAWVNFNGTGTVAIRASGNVSSITDNGTATFTINFATSMQDANYALVGFCNFSQSTAPAGLVTFGSAFAPAAGSCQIVTANSTNASLQDAQHVHVAIFR